MDNTQYYPIVFDGEGKSFVVINNGTAPAPCILTIIPKVDFLKLVVEGSHETPITFTGTKSKSGLGN